MCEADCPTGWGTPLESGVEIGRLAVQTGVFPLYEIENGKYKINVNTPRRKPVADYLKMQRRFRHLSEQSIKVIQDRVDRDYNNLVERAEKDKAS